MSVLGNSYTSDISISNSEILKSLGFVEEPALYSFLRKVYPKKADPCWCRVFLGLDGDMQYYKMYANNGQSVSDFIAINSLQSLTESLYNRFSIEL